MGFCPGPFTHFAPPPSQPNGGTNIILFKVPNKSFGKKHFGNNRRHKTPFNSKNHIRGGKLILEISKKALYIIKKCLTVKAKEKCTGYAIISNKGKDAITQEKLHTKITTKIKFTDAILSFHFNLEKCRSE